jgi:hypothetical protein
VLVSRKFCGVHNCKKKVKVMATMHLGTSEYAGKRANRWEPSVIISIIIEASMYLQYYNE